MLSFEFSIIVSLLLRVKGVHEKGVREGKASASNGDGKSKSKSSAKKGEPPAPTPANREDVVFEVTDKTLQKVRPAVPPHVNNTARTGMLSSVIKKKYAFPSCKKKNLVGKSYCCTGKES